MLINRSHIPWFIMTLVATVLIGLGYHARFDGGFLAGALPAWLKDSGAPRQTIGGTRIGLLYGTLAYLIFLFAAALGGRKKKPLWPLGDVKVWLRAHIWLTILTIPLVGYHCGWVWGSPQTSWVLWLYIVVMASGFFGLAMQQVVPGIIKERLGREVVYDQIPNFRHRLVEQAKELRQTCAVPVAMATAGGASPEVDSADIRSRERILEFLDEQALPYLTVGNGEKLRLGKQRESDAAFKALMVNVARKWRENVEELKGWCDERRAIDVQRRLQRWLHWWLLVHAPVSFLLIVVTLWHAVVAVRLFIVQP